MALEHLVWIDLETTGSDLDQDFVLEIAMVVTKAEPPFDIVRQPRSSVICWSGTDWLKRLAETPEVLEMHQQTGLLLDCMAWNSRTLQDPGPELPWLSRVDEQFAKELGEIGRPHTFMMAGSGVGHFDKPIVDRCFPRLAKFLQYPVIDVGVLRRTLRMVGWGDVIEATYGSTIKDGRKHRAYDDIMDHRNELETYCRLLTELGLPVNLEQVDDRA